ncbi:hypothetical protein BGX24_005679 [Mortierella sp. AD032]|nr:hypothetical protein BGX24_005679 [Mortierella sp. AD032]
MEADKIALFCDDTERGDPTTEVLRGLLSAARSVGTENPLRHNPRITAYNIHRFLDMDVDRNAVAKWERDYDKIKFDVQHGRGSKCKLSSSEDDVVLHYVNESVFQWLKKMREEGSPVSGRQFSNSAKDSIMFLSTVAARRMDEINEICDSYDLDDIFNCDETGLYLTDLSDCSYTTEDKTSGVKPKRGARASTCPETFRNCHEIS